MNRLNNLYLEETFDLLEDIVFFKDTNGIYLSCNTAFCKFFSLAKEDIIGKTDYDLVKKSEADLFRDNDKQTIKNKKKSIYTESITLESDEIIYFKSTKDVILDENSNVVGTVGIAKNITKQIEYEILYKIDQKILEKIIENVSLENTLNFIINEAEKINKNMICSILLLNKETNKFKLAFAPSLPDYYNKTVCKITIGQGVGSCGTAAFTKERVIVKNINEHPYWAGATKLTEKLNLHACWSQPFFCKDKEVAGTFAIYYNRPKTPTSFELKLIDSFSYLVALAVNKKQELQRIKENENLLVQQSKLVSIGDMLESISHHWRQPLSVISTISSALKIDKEYYYNNPELYNKSLAKVIKTTQNLSHTIDDFRNYFIKNHPKDHFFIKNTMSKTLDILNGKFNESNIKFILDIEDLNIYNYENEFIHIFLNLFNNSKDAFEFQNIKERYIFIEIKKTNNNCMIKIKDNAKGIDSNIIDRIFEPYFTTKHKSSGTGIGLYSIQEILTRHLKGNIKVKNASFTYNDITCEGAQFTITIPLNNKR